MSELDLFGHEQMHRTARFVGAERIELGRRWGPGPKACVIGCNPSTANAFEDDPTCRWWNAWFQLFGFGGYTAVNLYPFCTSSPAECRRIVEHAEMGLDVFARERIHLLNLPVIVEIARAADQVFVCWGAIAWDRAWIDQVAELIQTGEGARPDLWCWGLTESGAPKHPMARGVHRIARDQPPILWRAAG